jgi:osmoprotectant transport system permease protein
MSALGEFWDFMSNGDNWEGARGIPVRTWATVKISAAATAFSALVAIPPAVWLAHIRRGGLLAVSFVNIGRALPSFGIIALVLPISIAWGFGLGFWPTFVALVLLGVPPIFTNSYTGVREVDRGIVEAATGMGLTGRAVLTGVEIPNAMPLIITGIRLSAVQIVATATLGALVGYPCLGSYVVEGKAQLDDGKLLAGAVLIAVLAIVTELAFSSFQRAATPWLRDRRGTGVGTRVAPVELRAEGLNV